MDNSAIMCDEIIESCDEDTVAEAKSNDETKIISINFNEKKYNLQNIKFLYFTYFFINYYSIIDSC